MPKPQTSLVFLTRSETGRELGTPRTCWLGSPAGHPYSQQQQLLLLLLRRPLQLQQRAPGCGAETHGLLPTLRSHPQPRPEAAGPGHGGALCSP